MKVFFFQVKHGECCLFQWVGRLSSVSFMPEKKALSRSINFNDNYFNKMKEFYVVLHVRVVLYKFEGDCSF